MASEIVHASVDGRQYCASCKRLWESFHANSAQLYLASCDIMCVVCRKLGLWET